MKKITVSKINPSLIGGERCKVRCSLPLSILCCLVGLFTQPGCSDAPVSLRPDQKAYFNLKDYFEQEEKRLAAFPKVKKIANVDGQQNERVIDSLPIGVELKVFSNADINRPAWSDKYAIDSIFNDRKQLIQLKYTAKEKDLRTQHITIDFEEGAVKKVFIGNGSFTFVASTEQFLTYLPDEGYKIESRQKVAFTQGDTFLIDVRFLK